MADFYLMNLDWGDGSKIEFTNKPQKFYDGIDIFDHVYDKPGFYTIKGLVAKVEENTPKIRGWEKFESNIVVNKSNLVDSPFFHHNKFAMIGGYTENSTYFKSLLIVAGLNLEKDRKVDLQQVDEYNEYDKIFLLDTLAKFDSNLYDGFLNSYNEKIYNSINEQTEETLIHNNYSSKKNYDDLKATNLNNVDVGSCKMYSGVRKMHKHLGFNNQSSAANPNDISYWKNIIPKNWKWTDKEGIEYGVFRQPTSGSKALVDEFKEYKIDDSASQNWKNGHYWPILPKLNTIGKFESEVTSSYGFQNSEVPITNLNEDSSKLILDIDFNQDTIDDVIDKTSQFQIEGSFDFAVNFDENFRVEKSQKDDIELLVKNNSEQAF